MKKCSTKKIICMSVLPLVSQIAASAPPPTYSSDKRIRMMEERIAVLEHKEKKGAKNQPIDPVLALPQSNLREKYDTASSYNTDLALLKMRKKYYNELKQREIVPLPYPRIELGGSIIGLGTYRIPPKVLPRNGKPQSDLNLSGANLNVTSEIMEALMGSLRISYNPNGSERLDETTITTRVANSSIFLNTAFITFGDLNRSPLYASVGQMYLPFGQYNSNLMFAPLSARLGRFRQRPIIVGVQQPGTTDGFNASVFAFSGDSFVGPNSNKINNNGANIGYIFNNDVFSFNTGASYVHNIADSGGMQNTGASAVVTDAGEYVDNEFIEFDDGPLLAFRGFGAIQRLVHAVPAFDTRARIGIKPFHLSFYGEIVRTTTAFAEENLSFNDGGARPSAWNTEGSYMFSIWDMESSVTIGYGQSAQALALNLPQRTAAISFSISPHKYISCSIGYQYDTAYPITDDASGQLLPVSGIRFLGTTTKTTTAQVNARF